jgi:exonuclease SbcC
VRSDRIEKRGKQSGLGLDVYDHYTGQLRDVRTLSGGEKFNASLCLALGLADVIQAYQGGISLETMFIDEGFGSLDEESLTQAIDTLIDLQRSGRMIGVISHVQELKQAIPAVLEVMKTKEGHSYTRFRVS